MSVFATLYIGTANEKATANEMHLSEDLLSI